jgi:hypothetical protein
MHHTMKTYGREEIKPQALTSTLNGDDLASRSVRFDPREKVSGTNEVGYWVGPRASLEMITNRENLVH